jgi:hypothetical protein
MTMITQDEKKATWLHVFNSAIRLGLSKDKAVADADGAVAELVKRFDEQPPPPPLTSAG